MSKARQAAASRARATLDEAILDRVCARHADGAWLKHACALEGTTYDILRHATEANPQWALKVEEAHAKGGEVLRRRMLEAGVETDDEGRTVRTGDWKREAWLLERWDQATFHLTTKTENKNEHSAAGGAPLTISIDTALELARKGRP